MSTSVNHSVAVEQNARKIAYVSQLETPVGYVQIFATQSAITAIQFSDQGVIENENAVSALGKQQLTEYFAAKRTEFDLPLRATGTEFQTSVWRALMDIGYGATASYLDIAKSIGNSKACRAVGAANGKNPIAIVVPCHRIIGTNGKLTGYAGGMTRKSFLLSLESHQPSMFIESI